MKTLNVYMMQGYEKNSYENRNCFFLSVARGGHDPSTSGLWIRRSNQLSYRANTLSTESEVHRLFFNCGCKGTQKIPFVQEKCENYSKKYVFSSSNTLLYILPSPFSAAFPPSFSSRTATLIPAFSWNAMTIGAVFAPSGRVVHKT